MAPFASRRLAFAAIIAVAAAAGGVAAIPAHATHVLGSEPLTSRPGPRLVMPIMNPERGKTLFVAKGCFACHAINGVGGHDAPNLDAHTMDSLMNPFDFAAKMWNHAPAMIIAQQEALGEQVYFTGDELADIIAFVHDDEAQHTFADTDLTPEARMLMHHQHGDMPGPKAHAEELGHHHPPGTAPHKD